MTRTGKAEVTFLAFNAFHAVEDSQIGVLLVKGGMFVVGGRKW